MSGALFVSGGLITTVLTSRTNWSLSSSDSGIFWYIFQVRELQRVTGAQVKIPDDAGEDETQESTTVRVLGNFQASQAVQARLAQLMQEFAHRLSQWSTNGQAPTQGVKYI